MSKSFSKKHVLANFSAILIVLIEVVMIWRYLLGPARYTFHSDSAVKTILADIAIEQGRFLPVDWVYANGDLPVAGTHIFSLILALAPIGAYQRNALAAFFGYLFFLGCYFGFAREVFGRRAAMGIAMIAAAGISMANMEFLIQQSAYAIYAGLALCLVALTHRIYSSQKSERWAVGLIALLVFWLGLSNPVRVLVQIVAPLTCAGVVLWLMSLRFKQRLECPPARTQTITVTLVPLLALLAAWAVYRLLLMPSRLSYGGHTSIAFADVHLMIHQMRIMPLAWLEYHLPRGNLPVTSVVQRLMLAVATLITVASMLAVLANVLLIRRVPNARLFVSLLAAAMVAAGLIPLIISSDLWYSYFEVRYALVGSLIVLAIGLETLLRPTPKYPALQRFAVAVIALYSVGLAWSWLHPPAIDGLAEKKQIYAERMQSIAWLEQRQVRAVAASYWNAHILTVLSDMKIHASPVTIPGNIRPFVQHSYRGTSWTGMAAAHSALLYDDAETNAGQLRLGDAQFGTPEETTLVGRFNLRTYAFNIFDRLPQPEIQQDSPISENDTGLGVDPLLLPACGEKEGCLITVRVVNLGKVGYSSSGKYPFHIAAAPVNTAGKVQFAGAARGLFVESLAPSASSLIVIRVPQERDSTVDHYQVCLVQELVAWHCATTKTYP